MSKINYKKWSTLIGGGLIHFTFGAFTFGNFSPYLTSYLREITGSDIRYATSNWIQTSSLVALSITSVLTGLFISRFHPSHVLLLFFGLVIQSYKFKKNLK